MSKNYLKNLGLDEDNKKVLAFKHIDLRDKYQFLKHRYNDENESSSTQNEQRSTYHEPDEDVLF